MKAQKWPHGHVRVANCTKCGHQIWRRGDDPQTLCPKCDKNSTWNLVTKQTEPIKPSGMRR